MSFAQYLCTGFGNRYNYILEPSIEYRVGVPQSSIKGGILNVYTSNFSTGEKCPKYYSVGTNTPDYLYWLAGRVIKFVNIIVIYSSYYNLILQFFGIVISSCDE